MGAKLFLSRLCFIAGAAEIKMSPKHQQPHEPSPQSSSTDTANSNNEKLRIKIEEEEMTEEIMNDDPEDDMHQYDFHQHQQHHDSKLHEHQRSSSQYPPHPPLSPSAMFRLLGAHFQSSLPTPMPSGSGQSTTPTLPLSSTGTTSPPSHPSMFMGGSPQHQDFSTQSSSGAAGIIGPQCPHCGKIYSNVSNLRQHVRNVHMAVDKSLWHTCPTCGKKLKTKHYLINHQLQAHGIHQRSTGSNT